MPDRPGPMRTRQTLARARPRDRILAAATKLFLEEGIQAVGINRIIAEADVALMTVYRQFGSKDELVAAALEQWSDQRLHWLTDWLDRCGDDPQARFTGLWDAMEDWLHSKELHGSLVANATVELRGKPRHPAHEQIAEHRMAMRLLLENLAKLVGASDPVALAAQLHILIDAVEVGWPADAANVRALADAALAASLP
jgi:AcrR family transcriptional regulator